MTESSKAAGGPVVSSTSRARHTWPRWILFFCLAIVVGFSIDAVRRTFATNETVKQNDEATVRSMGLVDPVTKALAPQFNDANHDLLADAPASADHLLDPDTLVLAHLVGSDAENPSIPWSKLEEHLAQVTGKKIVDEPFDNSPDQLARIKAGQIQMVALHAAETPFLVNNYGFQPAAVLGDDKGANGNKLDIIVPAASSIAAPEDLHGHALICTVPASITGYRAAVALLLQNQSLRPNVDYYVTWSLGQKESIKGIAEKRYEAAAVSDEKLQSLLQKGTVVPTDYKMIYQSEVIPRTTIGWFYNLKPETAAKVREAILSFRPDAAPTTAPADQGDNTDAVDTGGKPLHFIPIEYAKDFHLVREIDARFDPRMGAKVKAKSSAATAPADAAAAQ